MTFDLLAFRNRVNEKAQNFRSDLKFTSKSGAHAKIYMENIVEEGSYYYVLFTECAPYSCEWFTNSDFSSRNIDFSCQNQKSDHLSWCQ